MVASGLLLARVLLMLYTASDRAGESCSDNNNCSDAILYLNMQVIPYMHNMKALDAELASCMRELKFFLSSRENTGRPAREIEDEIESADRYIEQQLLQRDETMKEADREKGLAYTLDSCIERMRGRDGVNASDIGAFERESKYYSDRSRTLTNDALRMKDEIDKQHRKVEILKKELRGVEEGVFGDYDPIARDVYLALRRLSRTALSRIYKHLKSVEAQISNAELSTAGMEIDDEIFDKLKEVKGKIQYYCGSGRGVVKETWASFIHVWLISLTFHNLSGAAEQFRVDKDIADYLKQGNYIAHTLLSVVMEDMKKANLFD